MGRKRNHTHFEKHGNCNGLNYDLGCHTRNTHSKNYRNDHHKKPDKENAFGGKAVCDHITYVQTKTCQSHRCDDYSYEQTRNSD